ncbi:MAG: PAS domain S-box protein [Candidatus Omnitrophica bacterium]|nr:PAS domain S-box protein [Candidatus Omnitrophota bacterium]
MDNNNFNEMIFLIVCAFLAVLFGGALIWIDAAKDYSILDKLLIFFIFPIFYAAFYFTRRIFVWITLITGGVSFWVIYNIAPDFSYSLQTLIFILVTAVFSSEMIFRSMKTQRNTEKFLRFTQFSVDHISDAAFWMSADAHFIYVNDKACHSLGYTREELLSMTVHDIDPEFPREKWSKHWEQLQEKKSFTMESLHRTKEGKIFPVEIVVNYMEFEGKEYNCAFARNITQRKQSEITLRESEAKFRALTETTTLATFIHCGAQFKYVNTGMVNISGFSKEELLKMNFWDLIHPDCRDLVRERGQARLHNDVNPNRYETAVLSKNGEKCWIDLSVCAFEFEQQPAVLGAFSDITDRKRAEEKIKESEQIYRSAIEVADAVPYYQNYLTNQYDFVGPGIELLTGYSPEEFTYDIWQSMEQDIVLLGDLAGMEPGRAVEKAKEGRGVSWRADYKIKNRFGEERWISNAAVQVRDEQGRIVGSLGILQDITERKRMEDNLLKARKLESVGILAGGIAHDFNNLLTAILGNVSLAKTLAAPHSKVFERLTEAEKASLRAQELTQQLLTFSKGGAPITKSEDIRALLKETALFILMGSNVRCEFDVPDDLWRVDVDKGQFSQVIQNLVINANQAMPEGGIITIRSCNCTNDDAQTNRIVPFPDNNYVRISIKDQGCGIPKAYLEKIFDPYFTTKQEGSGLGLATAYSIVEKHKGAITVNSQIGKGSTFTIYLPASKLPAPSPLQESFDVAFSGQGRILIMDDEEIVKEVTGEILTEMGYEVDFADDGFEAIQQYKSAKESKNPYTAVIMDLTIPGGMGGEEAVQELRAFDPDVKAIVSSGYSNDPIMSHYQNYGFCGVICKPFTYDDLGKVLQRAFNDDNP